MKILPFSNLSASMFNFIRGTSCLPALLSAMALCFFGCMRLPDNETEKMFTAKEMSLATPSQLALIEEWKKADGQSVNELSERVSRGGALIIPHIVKTSNIRYWYLVYPTGHGILFWFTYRPYIYKGASVLRNIRDKQAESMLLKIKQKEEFREAAITSLFNIQYNFSTIELQKLIENNLDRDKFWNQIMQTIQALPYSDAEKILMGEPQGSPGPQSVGFLESMLANPINLHWWSAEWGQIPDALRYLGTIGDTYALKRLAMWHRNALSAQSKIPEQLEKVKSLELETIDLILLRLKSCIAWSTTDHSSKSGEGETINGFFFDLHIRSVSPYVTITVSADGRPINTNDGGRWEKKRVKLKSRESAIYSENLRIEWFEKPTGVWGKCFIQIENDSGGNYEFWVSPGTLRKHN